MGTAELARLTGTSIRQLQWWDEVGLVVPAQPGGKRQYRRNDIHLVRLVVAMRRKGILPGRMNRIFSGGAIRKALAFRGSGYYLVTDGRRRAVVTQSETEVIAVMRKATCGLFVIHMPGEDS